MHFAKLIAFIHTNYTQRRGYMVQAKAETKIATIDDK